MHTEQDLPAADEAPPARTGRTLALAPVETTGRVAELHQQLLAMLGGEEAAVVDAAAVERIDGAALQLLLAARRTFYRTCDRPTDRTTDRTIDGSAAVGGASEEGAADGLAFSDPSAAFLEAVRVLGLTELAPTGGDGAR